MAEHLHRLQPVGLPTMIPNAQQVAREQGIAAMAGARTAHHDQHPDLSARHQPGRHQEGRVPSEPPLPPDPPTGPPPAFEANVLEVEARALGNPTRCDEVAREDEQMKPAKDAQGKWQAPALPDPAMIDRQF